MVIDKIDVRSLAILEMENNSPVRADSHGPKTLEIACQRMKPEGCDIDVGSRLSGMHYAQNLPDLANVFRINPFGVVIFEKLSQPFVPEALDHCPSIVLRVV
jgi:hypothetical protein